MLLNLQGYMLIQHNHTFTDSCIQMNHVIWTREKNKRTFLLATARFTSLYARAFAVHPLFHFISNTTSIYMFPTIE